MKVLYVEDDAEARELIARFLGEAGLSVETARDGRLGLERALGRAYDALVLDVKLPGMDGFELIRRIRAAGVTTPVLCLTALGEASSSAPTTTWRSRSPSPNCSRAFARSCAAGSVPSRAACRWAT
jgi:DNA-binding response OmpR family regulator